MAHAKISELTELAEAPVGGDFVPILDSSTLVTKKIQVYNLLSERYRSVKWYGAKGDGITDDTTAIQDAIDDITTGTILFPVGTYISSQLTPKTGITFLGEGNGISNIKLKAATNDSLFDGSAGGLTNIIFRDLGLDGNKASQTAMAGRGIIDIRSSTKIAIVRCYIHDCDSYDGIYFSDNEDCWILYCIVKDNDRNGISCGSGVDTSVRMFINFNKVEGHNGASDIGIALEAAADSEAIGNTLVDNTSGITIVGQAGATEDANGNIIDNNIIDIIATGGDGIHVRGDTNTANYNKIRGNTIKGGISRGIRVDTAHYTTIKDNTIQTGAYADSGKGIDHEDSDYGTIVGNVIYYQRTHGIVLTNSDRNNINSNQIYDCSQKTNDTYYGIALTGSSSYNVVNGNVSTGAKQKYGIGETGTADHNVITGNQVSGNATLGVAIAGANTVVGFNDGYLTGTAVIDPSNLVDGAGESHDITVTGAAVGDGVMIYPPYDTQELTICGYVRGANTVEVRIQNETTGAVNLGSGTWKARVFKN